MEGIEARFVLSDFHGFGKNNLSLEDVKASGVLSALVRGFLLGIKY